MGCDIHLYAERKNETGQWESADKWTPDDCLEEGEAPRLCIDYKDRFYSGRNYDLFSILANVRNGYGFAGVKTGEGFVPLAQPRGLPVDATELVKQDSDRWDCDGHSHSFCTVAELLAYDWTQVTKHCGWLTAAEYWDWNRFRRADGDGPKGYCGGVSGPSVKHVTEDAMKEMLKPYGANWQAEEEINKDENLRHTYVQCEWELPYYKSATEFWGETIPRLLRLGKPEDVRLVFWFDN